MTHVLRFLLGFAVLAVFFGTWHLLEETDWFPALVVSTMVIVAAYLIGMAVMTWR